MRIPRNKAVALKTGHRILLAVDAVSCSQELIDLAVDMASMLGLQLHGLFVEDIDLLSVAGRPFATEITLATADVRTLDPDSLLRSFRAIDSEIRAKIEYAAGLASVQCSFETIRGRRIEAGLANYQDTELIIIGQQVRVAARLPKQSAFISERKQKRLLLIDDKTFSAQHAVDLILRLSTGADIDLTLMTTDQSSTTLSRLEAIQDNPGIICIRRLPLQEEILDQMMQKSGKPFDFIFIARALSGELLSKISHKLVCSVIVVI